MIAGGKLVTPRYKPDVFPGITRQVVLELALSMGIETSEVEVGHRDLAEINGAFLCSTLMEIRAVSQLGQRVVPTAELPYTRAWLPPFVRSRINKLEPPSICSDYWNLQRSNRSNIDRSNHDEGEGIEP